MSGSVRAVWGRSWHRSHRCPPSPRPDPAAASAHWAPAAPPALVPLPLRPPRPALLRPWPVGAAGGGEGTAWAQGMGSGLAAERPTAPRGGPGLPVPVPQGWRPSPAGRAGHRAADGMCAGVRWSPMAPSGWVTVAPSPLSRHRGAMLQRSESQVGRGGGLCTSSLLPWQAVTTWPSARVRSAAAPPLPAAPPAARHRGPWALRPGGLVLPSQPLPLPPVGHGLSFAVPSVSPERLLPLSYLTRPGRLLPAPA